MLSKQRERRRQLLADAKAQVRPVEAGPGGVLHSFVDGMGTPIRALAQVLGDDLRTGTTVTAVHAGDERRFRVALADGDPIDADMVLLTTPAPVMAAALRLLDADAADALAAIPIASIHVVCLGVRNDQLATPADGFGALIPRVEGIRTLGIIFSSSTFDGRAPRGTRC